MQLLLVIVLTFNGIFVKAADADCWWKFGEKYVYPCHCRNNEVCDRSNGSCPSGCDDGYRDNKDNSWHAGAWTGFGCQIGNVAYDKSARQVLGTWGEHGANRVIDGDLSPKVDDGYCACPLDGTEREPAWWQVDLGMPYVVLGLNITNPDAELYRNKSVQNVVIYVTDEPNQETADDICNTIGAEQIGDNLVVNCTQPVKGRYVKLRRKSDADYFWVMYLCEIQVYGYLYHDCPDDYFGVACSQHCECNGPCDDITGRCLYCPHGWMGNDCNTACLPGTWGAHCRKQCNCRDEQEVCDRFHGNCKSGCPVGFGDIDCYLEIPTLYCAVELSSANRNEIQVRIRTWVPTNVNETTPSGYLIKWRIDGDPVWSRGFQIEHNATAYNRQFSIKGLEPDTLYFIQITPFVKRDGLVYYRETDHEYGPISTLSSGDAIGMIAVGVVALFFLVVLIIIVLKRHLKLQKNGNTISISFSCVGDQTATSDTDTGNTPDRRHEIRNSEAGGSYHTYQSIDPSLRSESVSGYDTLDTGVSNAHLNVAVTDAHNATNTGHHNSQRSGYENVVGEFNSRYIPMAGRRAPNIGNNLQVDAHGYIVATPTPGIRGTN